MKLFLWAIMKQIDIERLKTLLIYDPETGIFINKISRINAKQGMISGNLNGDGYLHIEVDGKRFRQHALAWFYHYGEPPAGIIDHINGIRTDNRIANLRLVTAAQNRQNVHAATRRNKSGLIGAHYCKNTGRWASAIKIDGKKKFLGYFKTAEEASKAYLFAKKSLHPYQTLVA